MRVGTDLIVGLALTAVAYGFLLWAVIHGKHVVDEISRGERPGRPSGDGESDGTERTESGRE